MPLPGQHPMDLTNLERRLLARIAELERRVARMERHPEVPILTTTPTGGTDGQIVGSTTPRIWLKVNGTWRYSALT